MPSPKHILSPPPSTTTNPTATRNITDNNDWGPFRNAANYGADMALVLGILFCIFILAFSLVAAIRFFLRRRTSPPPLPASGDSDKPNPPTGAVRTESQPLTVLYSAGTIELAGAAAECAICLTEFAEGDGVRVLPACKHGFHVKCVEMWLSTRSSCPNCRATCCRRQSTPAVEEP